MLQKLIAILLVVNAISNTLAIPIKHNGYTRNIEFDEAMLGFPEPNGNLNIFALPVGDGDATFIQCPSGDVIVVDLGRDPNDKGSGWTPSMVRGYLSNILKSITTIIVSRPTPDHYSYIAQVLDKSVPLSNIILAGKRSDYSDDTFLSFINNNSHIVNYINSGNPCISDCPNDAPKCPSYGNQEVVLKYLAANVGTSASSRSISLQVIAKNFKLLLPGDFLATDIEKQIIDEWLSTGYDITSTHYKLSNRGSVQFSNTQRWLNAIQATYAFSSNSYPHKSTYSPDCLLKYRFLPAGIGKRSSAGPYTCAYRNYDEDGNVESIQLSYSQNYVYQIYTTSPSSSSTEMIKISVNLCDKDESKIISTMKSIPMPF